MSSVMIGAKLVGGNMRYLVLVAFVLCGAAWAQDFKCNLSGVTTRIVELKGYQGFHEAVSNVDLRALPILRLSGMYKTVVLPEGNVSGSTTSGADGRFAFDISVSLPKDCVVKTAHMQEGDVEVAVMGRGTTNGVVWVRVAAGSKQVVNLSFECSLIKGKAKDASGQPMAGFEIVPHLLHRDSLEGIALSWFSSKTGKEGEFSFIVPCLGQLELRIGKKLTGNGYPTQRPGTRTNAFGVIGGAEYDLGDLVFVDTGTIKGAPPLVKRRDGRNASWALFYRHGETVGRKHVYDDGAPIELIGPVGRWELSVYADRTYTVSFDVVAEQAFDLSTLNLPLPRRIIIEIKAPLTAKPHTLEAVLQSDEKGPEHYSRWSEVDAVWSFDGVSPEIRQWKLSAQMEGAAPIIAKPVEIDEKVTRLTLEFSAYAYLTVNVKGRRGADADSVRILAMESESGSAKAFVRGGLSELEKHLDEIPYRQRRAEAMELSGSRKTELAPGKYVVIAVFYPKDFVAHETVELVAGGEAVLLLEEKFRAARVRLGLGGKPLANERVRIVPADGRSSDEYPDFEGATDEHGVLAWQPADAGMYSITLLSENYWAPAQVPDARISADFAARHFTYAEDGPEELALDLTLKYHASVRFVYEAPAGEMPQTAYLTLMSEWTEIVRYFRTDDIRDVTDGASPSGILTPGRYRLLTYPPEASLGAPGHCTEIEIAPGEHGDKAIKLVSRAVHGRVKVEAGVKAHLQLSWISPEGGRSEYDSRIDVADDGTFTLPCPPLGDYMLSVVAGRTTETGFERVAALARRFSGATLPGNIEFDLTGQTGSVVVSLKLPKTPYGPFPSRVVFTLRSAKSAELQPGLGKAITDLDDNDATLLEYIPAGTYDLLVSGERLEDLVIPAVRVEAGKTALCEGQLKPARRNDFEIKLEGRAKELALADGIVEFLDSKGKVLQVCGFYSQSASRWASLSIESEFIALRVIVRDPHVAKVRLKVPKAKAIEFEPQHIRFKEEEEDAPQALAILELMPE